MGDVGAVEAVDAVDAEHAGLLPPAVWAIPSTCKEVIFMQRILLAKQMVSVRLTRPWSPDKAALQHVGGGIRRVALIS